MMKKGGPAELIIVPAPGKGHLVSTMEFAKHLLLQASHDQLYGDLSITVLIIPSFSALGSSLIVTSTTDDEDDDGRIQYIHIPQVEQSFTEELLHSAPEKYISVYIESHKFHVMEAVSNLAAASSAKSGRLVGLVVDLFCTSMIDVANEFGIPSYVFFTSSAAFLGFMYYLPTRDAHFEKPDDDYTESSIPCCVNPVPASSLPTFSFSKDGFEAFATHAKRFKETKGTIVNTFVELESHAVNSLLSDGDETPPVYTVGPLLDLSSLEKSSKVLVVDDKADKIMNWLDNQPQSSVVLLCFGSMGAFDESQIREIALGLERSGHRFLWSVRRPPSKGKFEMPTEYTNYEEILPSGFLERTGERGMICGWVPQVKTLAHKAIGGFVSHCGWNSTLESLWFGVPIAAWPMYAEQQLNAFQMVKDLGLAVEVKLSYRMGGYDLVMADEIERAVACLMDGDSEVRKRVKDIGEKSRKAVTPGGSSFASLERLTMNMFGNIS